MRHCRRAMAGQGLDELAARLQWLREQSELHLPEHARDAAEVVGMPKSGTTRGGHK